MGDSGRIAAQIVTGIGFLGAGVIIKSGMTIRGLTTAACLWTTAAIGMASGGGYYWIAFVTTMLALLGLIVLKFVEPLYSRESYRNLSVITALDVDVTQIIGIVKRTNIKIINWDMHRDYDTGLTSTQLSIRLFHRGNTDELASGVIESLESAFLALKEIRWHHD